MKTPMILIKLNEMVQKSGRSLYWLAQNSGVPYVTLWNLNKKETQRSIDLPVLSRICSALDCLPGDLLVYIPDAEDQALAALIKSKTAKKGSTPESAAQAEAKPKLKAKRATKKGKQQ